MRRVLPIVLALVFATPLLAEQPAGAPGGPFVLGVLRRDGVAIPFATFDGRRFRATWPRELRLVELPISIENIDRDWWGTVPPPQSMTLWADGKAAGDLKLLATAFINFRCDRRLGLRTNYHPAVLPPPASEQPFPKDGLLITGSQRIDAVETVAKDSPEFAEAAAAIADKFNSEENYATTTFTNWRHPVPKDERRKLPIEVEALYKAPMDEPGWTAYYVEAVRRYEPRPEDDDECGLLTSARGWLRKGPKGRREVTLGAQITYCDRHGVSFMLPLGLLKLPSGTHWIYQLAGYYSESYLIAKPKPGEAERILAYPAMSCPIWMM